MFTLFSLFVLALSMCALSCAAGKDQDIITTPSSQRRIPRSLIAKKIASVKQDGDSEEAHVFEVNGDGFLVGSNFSADISTGAKPISFTAEESSFTISVNGEERSSKEFDSVVHTVGDYNVIFGKNRKVLSLWGNHMLLEPVDHVKYPNVFVNVQKKDVFGSDDMARVKTENSLEEKKDARLTVEGVQKQLTGCRLVQIAVAFDNSLCARFGNSAARTSAFVRSVVRYGNNFLRRDTCHQLRVIRIEAHCRDRRDPYRYQAALRRIAPSERSKYILNRFRGFWLKNRRSVPRDVAYFFSGFLEGTGIAGRAFIGAACSSFGYGWVERGNSPLFVHEIGHTLGARHTTVGIMKPIYSGGRVFFSAVSKSQIAAYLRQSRTRCIGRV